MHDEGWVVMGERRHGWSWLDSCGAWGADQEKKKVRGGGEDEDENGDGGDMRLLGGGGGSGSWVSWCGRGWWRWVPVGVA